MPSVSTILQRPEFRDRPPVLLDVGASGSLNPKWRAVARHSVCIAFDADDRDIDFIVHEDTRFKKLYTYNCIVSSTSEPAANFFLTRSPYCSSLLEPNADVVSQWHYAPQFDVLQVARCRSRELKQVLEELGISYVDWFKTDSQGTDLRLFRNIGARMIERVLVAEFEPGFQQFYRGEDTFRMVADFMEDSAFWMSEATVKGSQRITHEDLTRHFEPWEQRLTGASMKTSPGWVEVEYMNTFRSPALGQREYLLGWVFAVSRGQHGFALHLAREGMSRFGDPVFEELLRDTLWRIRAGWMKLPLFLFNKAYRKYVRL